MSVPVSPTRIELTTAAADGTIQVDTQPGCEWTASAGASWFEITSGAAGGGGHVDVLAEPPFSGQWRVLSAPDWITFTHPATGVVGAGDGYAWYAVSPNPSTEPRVGTITFCNGSLEIRQSGRSLRPGRFVAGDFDDDGRADPAVFRPSEGRWYVLPSGQNYNHGASFSHQWGLPGDVPVPGDFDGDKKTDLAVYRATGFAGFTTSGAWFLRYSSDAYGYGTPTAYPWSSAPYHALENRALLADFSGDGRADLTVYRPSSGLWFIKSSGSGYDGAAAAVYQWGLPGDVPLANDYDGDGRSDLAVWRPSSGMWFFRDSSASLNSWRVYQWGLPGDVPLGPR